MLDAGASTGGFTDVLLRRGAREVVAADVGRGLLVWRLQTDDRVVVLDRTNVRALTPEQTRGPVDLVVADLSFISLRLVLPALLACATEDADLVPMVKPQFEVGRERLGSGGVVRDPELRQEAVRSVIREADDSGCGRTASPPARCPARPATSSTSCGCAAASRTRTPPCSSRPPFWRARDDRA